MAKVSRLTLALAALTCILCSLPALADSQARIVRLSDVQGSVQIDKNSGLGFENAFLNLPVTQGAQLKTGDHGRAEVEFEDGSTLRMGPNSVLQFSTLGSTDAGKHISEISLVEGIAYVNWLGKNGDEFSLNFSREKLSLDRAAHFRAETSANTAEVAVFKGDLDVEGPSGKLALEKRKSATFDVTADDKSTVANKIEPEPLDSWDEQSIAYHDQYAKNSVSSPYGYGLSDLNYYGAYSNVPGYGMMWQPYFAGVGWDPFMDGAWGWYPGFGYMYASAYPWGWLPYRYGNWMFIPNFGWMWQPGGWNSYASTPRISGTMPVHFTPLVAPANGTVKTVVVGKSATATTTGASPRMVLRPGSAGFGIARGSLENLSHLNHQVAKSGSVEVQPGPQFATSSPGFRPGEGSFGPPNSPSSTSTSSLAHTSSAGHSSGSSSHH